MEFKKSIQDIFTILHYSSCDSTNTRIKQSADESNDNTVCISDHQASGRGRKDRTWLSRTGAGAWFSCLVKPARDISASLASGLVFVAALSAAKTLKILTNADIKIKWPNDIVLNGKKLCGIMCEMRARGMNLDYAVLGIGVNLLGLNFPPDLPYASSVQKETGLSIQPIDFLHAFLEIYKEDRTLWEENGLDAILSQIKPLSATLGQRVKAISDNETFEGIAKDILKDGSLLIDSADGEKIFIAGDVSVRGIMGYV
ncbi:MAG: biotin--[Clostridia bacterium]|nr:biotin--[acetyl-CoA-carboxylase] ligase [Clostridia bacterium]